MRKERNNFFQESSYNQGYYYNNMMPQNMPVPQMEASSSFYMNQNLNQNPSTYNDYQTRLARLERQVNRLESRITKLENISQIKSSGDDIDINSNMYMI